MTNKTELPVKAPFIYFEVEDSFQLSKLRIFFNDLYKAVEDADANPFSEEHVPCAVVDTTGLDSSLSGGILAELIDYAYEYSDLYKATLNNITISDSHVTVHFGWSSGDMLRLILSAIHYVGAPDTEWTYRIAKDGEIEINVIK